MVRRQVLVMFGALEAGPFRYRRVEEYGGRMGRAHANVDYALVELARRDRAVPIELLDAGARGNTRARFLEFPRLRLHPPAALVVLIHHGEGGVRDLPRRDPREVAPVERRLLLPAAPRRSEEHRLARFCLFLLLLLILLLRQKRRKEELGVLGEEIFPKFALNVEAKFNDGTVVEAANLLVLHHEGVAALHARVLRHKRAPVLLMSRRGGRRLAF